jgi:hypothetical protein
MKHTLRSLLLGGAAFVCVSGTAHAIVVGVAATATVNETINGANSFYTVDNTSSSEWYIYAFDITYASPAHNPQTTQPGWSAITGNGSNGCGDGYFCFYNSSYDSSVTTGDIAPGVIGSLFTFNAVEPASSYTIDFTNGETTTFLDGSTSTPLPAALPLFASGLGALGLLGWRRKRKAAALAYQNTSDFGETAFAGCVRTRRVR